MYPKFDISIQFMRHYRSSEHAAGVRSAQLDMFAYISYVCHSCVGFLQAHVQDSNAVKTPDLPCRGIAFLQLSC